MKRFRKCWLPALGGALLLACVALPVHADDPRSGLQYLPVPGSLPEGLVFADDKVVTQEGNEQHYPALRSTREYYYLYDVPDESGIRIKIYLDVELGYYSSEDAALRATKPFIKTGGVPVEMRRRFPEVYYYRGEMSDQYYAEAVKGHYDVLVRILIAGPHMNQSREQPVIAKGRFLFNWMMESVLKALPGEPGKSALSPESPAVTREELKARYADLREQHADLLASRIQVVAYRDKVAKMYHYNVLKLTLAFVMENIQPPTSITDLASSGINSLLEQAGFSSKTQGDVTKVEIQRRLLKLVRSLDSLADQYLDQAKDLLTEMAGIQAQLKNLPK